MLKIRQNITSKIAYSALFVAMCFIANYTYLPVSAVFAISFVPTILFLSGILLTPFLGFAVGFVSDMLGCFAMGYPPNIYILLGSSLWGLIMGLSFKYLKTNYLLKLIVGGVVAFVICSMFLNSYGLYTYTSKGTPFLKYMLVRAPIQALNTAVNIMVTYFVMKIMQKSNLLR